jgi:mRNA degradation ribonuclease J1/J2
MKERRGASYAGVVAVTVALDGRNQPQGEPAVMCVGLPETVVERAREAAASAVETVRRGDDDSRTAEDIRRFVRRELSEFWRKKPLVKVEIIRI